MTQVKRRREPAAAGEFAPSRVDVVCCAGAIRTTPGSMLEVLELLWIKVAARLLRSIRDVVHERRDEMNGHALAARRRCSEGRRPGEATVARLADGRARVVQMMFFEALVCSAAVIGVAASLLQYLG